MGSTTTKLLGNQGGGQWCRNRRKKSVSSAVTQKRRQLMCANCVCSFRIQEKHNYWIRLHNWLISFSKKKLIRTMHENIFLDFKLMQSYSSSFYKTFTLCITLYENNVHWKFSTYLLLYTGGGPKIFVKEEVQVPKMTLNGLKIHHLQPSFCPPIDKSSGCPCAYLNFCMSQR